MARTKFRHINLILVGNLTLLQVDHFHPADLTYSALYLVNSTVNAPDAPAQQQDTLSVYGVCNSTLFTQLTLWLISL